MDYEKLRLEDIGTRLQHYQELAELWEDGLLILRKMQSIYRTNNDAVKENELDIAYKFLKKQIEVMAKYTPFEVRDKIDFAHREVNEKRTKDANN